MSGFRGSDERLDDEIEALERIARIRLRRAAGELRALDRDLRELKRERARRKVERTAPESELAVADAEP
ncbi:MAG TPA: hypothetical protein VMG81_03520 [Thermoplasmata archaeon]|nr:hypothetical protein [Thermoplasmata archaeon]